MAAVLFDIEGALSRLQSGQLLVTANNRQRNHILRAYHNHTRAAQAVWQEPRVYALNQWLNSLWDQYLFAGLNPDAPMLIDRWQTAALWEQVIGDSSDPMALMRANELAAKAEAARHALQAWQCPIQELNQWPGSNQTFLGWLQKFEALLVQHQLTTQEQAIPELIKALHGKHIKPETQAYLYGFDDIAPLTQDLLEAALPGADTYVPPPRNQQLQRTCLADKETEIRTAALWADQILAQQNDPVVGIIVPDLGQQRERVERIFAEVFNPLTPYPDQPRQVSPFNFSAGTPLGQTPLVQAALALISLHCRPLTTDAAVQTLHSLFWGDYPLEKPARTEAAVKLRKLARHSVKSTDIRRVCRQVIERSDNPDLQLAKRLELASEIERDARKKRPLEYWLERITKLLDTLGWPGQRRLDSAEYQQMSLWQETLQELKQLSRLLPSLTLSGALSQLQKRLEKTPFQPQTPDSPIQVLGLLEASGLHFTHLWVMGMHQQAWPPSAQPNPLLPVGLQREWQMPKASAERELIYAEALTERLQTSAHEVIFSYPQGEGDRHFLCSALISKLPECSPESLLKNSHSLQQQHYQALATSGTLEWLDCEYGPGLAKGKLRGGTGIFTAQAKCPFSAFARYRLGAYPAEKPQLGFTPRERGTILHGALAQIWSALKDHAGLSDSQGERLHTLIYQVCKDTVMPWAGQRPELSPALCELEIERLTAQLQEWLALERERPVFTVSGIEQPLSATFSGYQFEVRLDRVDTLADGSRLIMDYKTGAANPSAWQVDRFTDPQLPLYAKVFSEGEVSSIAFASINAKGINLSGWGNEHAQTHTGIKAPQAESWCEQLEAWEAPLQQLADELHHGYASIQYRSADAQLYDEWLKPLTRQDEQPQLRAYLQARGGKS
ncbi:PD-(D/E)XK nuclease family protein [Gilvimarinus xylanilyticus]|uniref:PD-(D/E)XK nuclease family protein n=1 Tax=Gilvimarinus xylanilyticus TaxID=2944139 RepID=A0A9X2I0I8_9GAMM|nr:PD-(D/E)XK nuclease family protein [Gilvimarinus xylanilyticus]MCP8898388.1 PD-(D/E)XK nuclease family protein [Gilvimarinus xylanilyticus]